MLLILWGRMSSKGGRGRIFWEKPVLEPFRGGRRRIFNQLGSYLFIIVPAWRHFTNLVNSFGAGNTINQAVLIVDSPGPKTF